MHEPLLVGVPAALLVIYVLFGVLSLCRCERKDVDKVLRTLTRRSKR